MLAAVLVVGAVFLHLQLSVYATGFGEQRILTLADGSVVTLNTESRMKVNFSDETRSIVLLQGEGFFRVAHDAKRPFLVSAGQAVVQAVGTQFNVNMVASKTIISVVDGVVKVSVENEAGSPRAPDLENAGGNSQARQARHEDSQLVLRKGEEARIDRQLPSGGNTLSPLSKSETPAALHAASWTEGRLEFESAPLSEVMSQFQRYRELEVDFDSDATRQLKISGSFESRDPDSALAYIATIPGLRVDRKGPQSYFIRRD